MANKYTISKNVLKEYDEYIIEQRLRWPETPVAHYRDWIVIKLLEIKKKDKKVEEKKIKFKDFVYLTKEEYEKLIIGYWIDKIKEIIDRLSNYIWSKWDKYKSHYHTILVWFNRHWDKRIDQQIETKKKIDILPEKVYKPMTEEEKIIAKEMLRSFKTNFAKWKS